MKKHILVISQYFYPEQFRINDICKEWIQRGYKVTVVTGIPNYPQGKFYKGYNLFKKRKENIDGIDIIRIPLVPRGKNSIMLFLNYLSFVISGFFWNKFTKVKADSVFVFEVSPMTQALVGVWYSKKYKVPCNIYVQDLWPENVEIVTGISNKYVIGMLTKMVMYIYDNCKIIFTSSNSFRDSIIKRGISSDKVKFWPQYAEDFYVPLKYNQANNKLKDNKFNITFTGNIGYAQGLSILPKVASLLRKKSHNNVVFNIIGDGRYKEELIHEIKKLKLMEMFNFIDRQEPKEIPKYLSSSDAALLCLEKNTLFSMTIPAKLQSYMACGIPVLVSASGESNKIVLDSNSGFCSEAGEAHQLTDNIEKMLLLPKNNLKEMGLNARQYYQNNFSKDKLLDKIEKYI